MNTYENQTLKRIIIWIVGASIGLLSNAETIKNVSHSPYFKLQLAETSQAMPKRNLENLMDWNLIPVNSKRITKKREETNKINPEYISDNDLDNYINHIYKKVKVPKVIGKEFLKSLINIESTKNIYAQSPKGARGLMQLIPDAWKEVDKSDFYENSFNPEKNIEVGIKYLKWINNYCNKNYAEWRYIPIQEKQEILAAAYNGGIGLLEKREWDIYQMPNETKNYVDSLKVSQARSYQDSTKID